MSRAPVKPTQFGLLPVILAAASIVGCDGSGDRDTAAEDASIGLELDLRIDGYRADLVPVHWMGVSPSGTIALTQVQDNNLRFFDSEGADLGSVGRAGTGPGEFARPVRGGWVADTLWVSDVGHERITLISPELDVVRTLPPLSLAVPRPEDSDRLPVFVLVFPYALYRDDVALAFAMGSAGDPLAEAFKGQPLIRVASDGKIERLVLETPEDCGSVTIRFDDGVASVSVPFFPRPRWAVSPDGGRIATVTTAISGSEGGIFEVKQYRAADGSEIFNRTFHFDGLAIPGHVRDSVIAAEVERLRLPAQRRAFNGEVKSRIPPVYAPVQAILIGMDGRVWVGLRQISSGNPWLILSAIGELVGRVMVPRNVTLHVADANYAWGLERDEVEVESVVRYRLPHAVEP